MKIEEYPETEPQDSNENHETENHETLKDMVRGTDTPLGEKEPSAPFAMVALSYPVMLILGLMLIAFLIWLF
ncbi:hypothetical protein [Stieleria varia]|uniref:Uncharacterized protein n=1 Tax=Stieleria varia TaxID=2528005 RepID=A0A5C6AS14_9BACT|nr:hypothetical protein [Stieleria varia]TWU00954.1 hypothetical protein Pla52n_43240 [Stieleria varia]